MGGIAWLLFRPFPFTMPSVPSSSRTALRTPSPLVTSVGSGMMRRTLAGSRSTEECGDREMTRAMAFSDPGPDAAREAEARQLRLREQLDLTNHITGTPRLVAGLDVSYATDSDRVVAAAVVIDLATMETVDTALVDGEVTVPYVPGLLAFREVPLLVDALSGLTARPELLVCDGYGIAHPRRFGLASHLGVVTGIPSLGVAKTPFRGTFTDPGPRRGDYQPLTDDGETLGRVLRTQNAVKPVFVSIGHRIDLDTATDLTLRLCTRFRLPETTRRADHISRARLHEFNP
jgi:deoxyribonuclease V